MDFHNFLTIYVFKGKESIDEIPTELRFSSNLINPSQLLVGEVLVIRSYQFLKFSHYSNIHVFEVRESIADISTNSASLFELPRKSR